MITVEKVSTRADFARLETVWNDLLVRSASDTITLTHQWLLTWWDVFGQGRELCVLLAREGEELIGIAPLLKRSMRHFGLIPLRRLEFLASGEAERDEICSDYLDFILLPGQEKAALEAFLGFLLQKEAAWDEMVLTDIAGEAPSLPVIEKAGRARGLSWQVTREQMCIFLPLPASHDELLKGVSGQNRKRITKDRRAAAEHGALVERVDGPDRFEAAFEALVRLHQARWTARGLPGSFSSAKFMRFHREVAPRMMEKGWLQLWTLSLDGQALCALYDFIYAGKIFYYQSGMNPADGPIRSPGLLLRDFAFEQAIAAGLTECDFLKGDEGSYKFGWGGQTRPIVQVRLARKGAREALFRCATRAVAALRPLKRRLQKTLTRTRSAEKPDA